MAAAQKGPDSRVPPGWEYNPSSWPQRIPIVLLAIVGGAAATYLALYQYRVFPTVWEPFFGNGSEKVLNSWLSHAFPVRDAALGAFGYFLDAVTGLIGGRRRWKTMPWMVVLFGLAIGPLGAVSVLFIILQPVLFDAYCTVCLMTAVVSVLMIGPAMDEFLASLQYLKRIQLEGGALWPAFWGTRREEH
jgi:uncharacterized membrane protein